NARERARRVPLDARRLDQCPAAEPLEPRSDVGQVLPPRRLRHWVEDLIPHREEWTTKLQPPGAPPEEPEMQVRRSVAPTIPMHLCDLIERANCAFEPDRHDTEFSGEKIRKVAEVEM